MLSTPHALVGLAIIQKFPHPAGVLFSFLSHFILDFFLPHWNPHLYTEFSKAGRISSSSLKVIIIDGLSAVLFTLFFTAKQLPNLNLAFLTGISAFTAVLPDAVEIPYYFWNWKNKWLAKYVYFEHKFQANGSFFWGILTQLLVISASIKVLFF